ncbi:dockerin type I domain-containing protein [Catenovulum sediminis]|uniref:dockerin type I domain-containing protein n=1 Tax=Catenovulum sediminis TaxID=1740262 RepID=UPI00117C07AD|nr:dockerin type I domain-containing protein [Catenovulum sediminis]
MTLENGIAELEKAKPQAGAEPFAPDAASAWRFVNQYDAVTPLEAANIQFNNSDEYTNTTYLTHQHLDVSLNIHAGSYNAIAADLNGVTLMLRQLTPSWTSVNDIIVTEPSIIGQEVADTVVSIPLSDVTPTSELPEGHFYFLFARFKSTDGNVYKVSTFPIEIELDSDADGIANTIDTDDDNDGVADAFDDLPLDSVYGVLGDFDGDQDVDRKDISHFVRMLRNPSLHREAFDFNGDGKVHQSDVSYLRHYCTRTRCRE